MEILRTENLKKYYGKGETCVTALDGVNFTVEKGEFVSIVGTSGSGKSTLLRTLAGSQQPVSGRISLCGKSLCDYSRRELAKVLSVVFTDRNGGGALTVEECVSIGRHPYTGPFGRLSEEDREIVNKAIADVGMANKAFRMLGTLSDGERQKTMIARALAQQTPLIILDEPTAFLDVAGRLDIMRLLRRLADNGRTILLSSHDIAPAIAVADTLLAIDPSVGKIACDAKECVVASGILDKCFPDAGIHFDSSSGDFRQDAPRHCEAS